MICHTYRLCEATWLCIVLLYASPLQVSWWRTENNSNSTECHFCNWYTFLYGGPALVHKSVTSIRQVYQILHICSVSYNAISCAISSSILTVSLWANNYTCPHPCTVHHIYGLTFRGWPSCDPTWIHSKVVLHSDTAPQFYPFDAYMHTIALSPCDAKGISYTQIHRCPCQRAHNKHNVEFLVTQSRKHTHIAAVVLSLPNDFTHTNFMYNVTCTTACPHSTA